MSEIEVKKQIEAIREFTQEALKSKELAKRILLELEPPVNAQEASPKNAPSRD